ncbi:uncharacterized protein LOC143462219 [Clavelina lepadiformis]|uniref:uncharacterized protein LOC143462219 n=1 Tax=Clavelina lepadiformis TaxID=159417 RepID=UPI00404275A5
MRTFYLCAILAWFVLHLAYCDGGGHGGISHDSHENLQDCFEDCEGPHKCVNMDEMKAMMSPNCGRCVTMACEDSSHPRMDCIEEAIAGCDECPSPTPEILSRRMRCVACRKECHKHHGAAKPKCQEKNLTKYFQECQESGECPLHETEHALTVDEECRTCVSEACQSHYDVDCALRQKILCESCSFPTNDQLRAMARCAACMAGRSSNGPHDDHDVDGGERRH